MKKEKGKAESATAAPAASLVASQWLANACDARVPLIILTAPSGDIVRVLKAIGGVSASCSRVANGREDFYRVIGWSLSAGAFLSNTVVRAFSADGTPLLADGKPVLRPKFEPPEENHQGLAMWGPPVATVVGSDRDPRNPLGAIATALQRAGREIWVFMGAQELWSKSPIFFRALLDFALTARNAPPERTGHIICIIEPDETVPSALAGVAAVYEWPRMGPAELTRHVEQVSSANRVALTHEATGDLVQSLGGSTAVHTSYALTMSMVRAPDGAPSAAEVFKFKKQLGGAGLIWDTPDPRGMLALGGLDRLKAWLTERAGAFSSAAREFGVQAPRGLIFVGVPGAGKSFAARVVPQILGMSMLRLDFGSLMSRWVGESGTRLRSVLRQLEATQGVVVIEELEKALPGGATGSNHEVSADVFGTFLLWLESQQGCFVIATSNSLEAIRPELLRAGRFDELFFFDLPAEKERLEILQITMAQRAKVSAVSEYDLKLIAASTPNFSGAELAQLVDRAILFAFNAGSAVTVAHLVAAQETLVPLATKEPMKIADMRRAAANIAIPASSPATAAETDATTYEGPY